MHRNLREDMNVKKTEVEHIFENRISRIEKQYLKWELYLMGRLKSAAGKISKLKTWKPYKPKHRQKKNVGATKKRKSLNDP